MTPAALDQPYDKGGTLIDDLPPINGPTETFLGLLDLSSPPEEQTYPSIGDRLEAVSLSWAWYNEGWNTVKPWALKTAVDAGDGSVVIDSSEGYLPHHNPFQYFPTWARNVKAGRMRDVQDFLEDVKNNNLPAVSFLKGTGSSDEHPAYSAPRWGEQWGLRQEIHALAAKRGSKAASSARLCTWCRMANARRDGPRRKWWGRTFASSSRSPKDTPTATCSSST